MASAAPDAHLVSRDAEDRPVYGGTPADFAVVQAIQEMKARGLRVTFYPFLLMDVPPGNTLPNPYTPMPPRPGQPSFPMARPDHLFPGGGLCRDRWTRPPPRQRRCRRCSAQPTPAQFSVSGEQRQLDRPRRRLGPAPA